MKKMCKVILAAAAIVALAVPAMAADKLIVKHTSGADAFKVTDGGQIIEYQVDAGTSDVTESARFERSSSGTPAAGFGVKNSQLLKLGSSSVTVSEAEVKIASTTAGAEGTTYTLRNYNNGALRDVFSITQQPVFNRYLPTGSWNATQAAATFALKKGAGTLANGSGPRMAFQSEDASTTTMLLVGSIAYPVDYTNQTSSLVFTTRGGVADTFATAEALRVTYDGKLGLGTTAPTSKLHVVGLPQYDTVTAATTAGLTSGAIFRTSGNILMIVP